MLTRMIFSQELRNTYGRDLDMHEAALRESKDDRGEPPPPGQRNSAAPAEGKCLVGDVTLPDDGLLAHTHTRTRATAYKQMCSHPMIVHAHLYAVMQACIFYSYPTQMVIDMTWAHRGYCGTRLQSA